MMTLAETIPKLPEIHPMTRRRIYPTASDAYDPKMKKKLAEVESVPGRAATKKKYYLSQQLSEPERWDHNQFGRWLEDMGYPPKPENARVESFPYDPKPIARDLGIKVNRVYAYWRGFDKGVDLMLPATMTLLCKARLELKRLGKKPQ